MEVLRPLESRAILLELVERMRKAESWAGETHIQKCVYFLQELLDVPTQYEYVLYKHGPYSFDLHDELTDMKANAILDLEPRFPYGPSFGLGQFAPSTKRYCVSTIERYQQALDFVAYNLSNRDVSSLERLATALYVSMENPDKDHHYLAKQVTLLKPHIQFEVALKSLGELDTIIQAAEAIGLRVLK